MKKFNLADWALRHKSIIYYFIAVLLTFGIFSFTHMGRMEDPDFTMRTMVVGVSWPGASPQQMSDQVTDKLEEKLRDLPGVDYTKSFTDGSKSVIYINLKEDLPSNKIRPAWEEARNMINDEWKSLPSGVQGPSINDRFDDVYGHHLRTFRWRILVRRKTTTGGKFKTATLIRFRTLRRSLSSGCKKSP